jgi:O-antigen ligase
VGGQTRAAARVFPLVLGSAGALASLVALYYYFFLPRGYDSGWHGGPGDHTSALITLMPCVIVAGWFVSRVRQSPSTSFWIPALAALFLASAYTASSRTVWPALAVQFVLLGALFLMRAHLSGRTTPRYIAASAAALTIAATIACVAMTVRVQADRSPLESDARLALWPKVVERIAERPLTGYGFGRGMLRESFTKATGGVDTNLWHTHNLVLEAAVQTGIPGLLLLVVLLGAVLREGWKRALRPEEAAAACGIALIAVVAGMLVRNMTDVLLARQSSLLYWGVVGMLLGLAARSSSVEQASAHH